ncbi:MAG: hypothetical protein Q7N87_01740 [Candidatus Uhrbacteria bacterium]|nr:hypothetical protein [Candidatus Uhrbacteria bacterium]
MNAQIPRPAVTTPWHDGTRTLCARTAAIASLFAALAVLLT